MMKRLLSALALGLTVFIPIATAQLEVNISRGDGDLKTPVDLPDFAANGVEPDIARQISDVIRADLESTGLFTIVPEAAHIQKDLDIEVAPRFADWKIIKSDALVVGSVEQFTRDGNLLLRGSVRLWDVYGEELMRFEDSRGRQVSGRRFTTSPDDLRRIAHKISDAIYTRLTGESGYFYTRIGYVAAT